MTSEFVNEIYTKNGELVQSYRSIYRSLYIAYVPNQLIDPRGHTAEEQFQKFENFLEKIFKIFFQNRMV